MSHGTFNSAALGPYTYDHGAAALQRWHREREQRAERQERLEQWMTERLAGLTFHSYDALVEAAVRHFQIVRGGPLTPAELRLIADAARCCWAGVSQRQRTALEINESGYVESLTFVVAA